MHVPLLQHTAVTCHSTDAAGGMDLICHPRAKLDIMLNKQEPISNVYMLRDSSGTNSQNNSRVENGFMAAGSEGQAKGRFVPL